MLRSSCRLCLALLFLATAAMAEPTKLLRFPDIHGDQVAFTYAGDIWLASADGGKARRLTAHPGQEVFARFSPDGQHIAFTGQYDGDEQVYVVPTAGGAPRQLTFYPAQGPLPPRWGYDNQVYDWTADGKQILYRSLRDGGDISNGQLYLVNADGGLPTSLPMPEAGGGDLSPDDKKVVYSPLARDFRSWKRYEGGWAQELYIFDLASHDLERVTDHKRADRDPMWIGNNIYFTSDRDGTLNLYSYNVGSKQTEQLTQESTWDVRWPNDDGKNQIVYELAGELVVYDIAAGKAQNIEITVPDDGLAKRPSRVSAENNIEDWELSPKGERALFVARGDIFTVPIEKGATRNLTQSSNAHDKHARWSPDGKTIAFVSDMSGEEEIYLIAQDGSGEPKRLTTDGECMRYAPDWSPDGKMIANTDNKGRLHVINVESKEVTLVADEDGFMGGYSWSPKGGYIAYSLDDDSGFGSIYVWSVATGESQRITGELFNEFNPAWGTNGDFLYYISARTYAPQISTSEWNYATSRTNGIFALALRKDVPHPFPPESDEVTIEEEKEGGEESQKGESKDAKSDKKKGKKDEASDEEKKPEYIEIDFDGLAERVVRVPVEADNINGVGAIDGHLVYFKGTPFYYGRRPPGANSLEIFSLKDREVSTLAENVGGIAMSADGKKILIQERGRFKLYDAKPKGSSKPVPTGGLMVDRVPEEEWEQIFDEVWRRFRDFFYVENMHGYDWAALREQYRPLLAHVSHRSDLNYVIGEMISELNVGHAYIAGGDFEIPARAGVALPGARFELDAEAGRYKIAKIFQGHNEEALYRSPLTEVGVDISEGDYVLAINGRELSGDGNPYQLLRHQDDHPVTLTVNDKADFEGSREVSFRPINTEANLIYLESVTRNREKVSKATDGRVGYLHIPDMGANGIREFIKYYYGQIRKEGLVVDVRGNGGGNISQMVIERLSHELLGTGFQRNSDRPRTYPRTVFHGSMVCLLDEDSASDGDIFPHMFRKAGLGPLIGKRSWGGVVGISGRGPLIDGGAVFVPEFSQNSVTGEWVIEGVGVEPDIEVDNDPKSVLAGRDPQLERAIEEVLKAMEADPKQLPNRPAPPVKTE